MVSSLLRRAAVSNRQHIRLRRCLSNLTRARELWGNRLVISPEVEHALETSQPIIALETAIVTHGMPYPTNLQTANSLESIIRSKSAVPATIALIDGRVHVGLTEEQLAQLADPESEIAKGAVKVSRRDLGPALALKKTGGTTVAGTMYVACTVGIKVFVTGGIGGVHRGAENSMDISADLIELGRTPMAVICAGAKSILDIPRTLEVLETQGVCVATYGDKSDFPAFYHPSSGCKSPWTVPDSSSAADLIHTSLSLPTPLSTLLAVPIPSEHTEAGSAVQQSVEQAVRESVEQGIDKRGKEVTPWLLKRVGELTRGKALELNVKLIENNARVGAEVAVKVNELYQNEHASSSSYFVPTFSALAASKSPSVSLNQDRQIEQNVNISKELLPEPSVLVFGSAAIDLTSTSPHPLAPGTTTPGSVFVSPGGVGRNIAEAAQNLLPAGAVQLISAYGTQRASSSSTSSSASSVAGVEPDGFGKLLMLELASAGLRTDGLIPCLPELEQSTAVCSLTLEKDGDLVAGVADMGIVETISAEVVEEAITSKKPKMVVFDCNLLEGVVEGLLRTCQRLGIPTFCDPTSTPKLPRLIPSLISLLPPSPTFPRPLAHISPNVLELNLLHSLIISAISNSPNVEDVSWGYVNSLNLASDWRNAVDRFTSPPATAPCESNRNGGGGGAIEGREWIRTEGIVQKMIFLLPFVSSFWVKAGSRGLLHLHISSDSPSALRVPSTSSTTNNHHTQEKDRQIQSIWQKLDGTHQGKYLILTHYPAPIIDPSEIVSTTGAGDTLVGGLVAGLTKGRQQDEARWVGSALEKVVKSLKSRRAVG